MVIMLIGFKLCFFTIIHIIAVKLLSEAVFISAQASPSSCFMATDYMTENNSPEIL